MSVQLKHELEKILEFSNDIICLIDEKGVFIRVSRAVTAVLSYLPTDVVGKSYKDFIHPDDFETSITCVRELIEGSGICQVENRYRHRKGHFVPISWSASWDADARIMYCIGRDVTATRQMEALLLRYDYVTRATSDAIWDWDLESGSLYWAEGFAKIFGYCLIALNNDISSWTGPIHPDDLERVLQSIHETIAGSADNWKEEYQFRRANGSYADVVDRGFVIRNAQGKAIRMVGAMHDISERKSAIRDLKQLADDLYERNGELQHFGYVVSHNLRSHVANIMGLTNLLELGDNDLETGEKCITELKTSVNRLDDVIKDLSKILSLADGSVMMITEPVDISEVWQNVLVDLGAQITMTSARVNITGGNHWWPADKAYIYSIFYNLLSNSLKYRSGKTPEIFLSVERLPDRLLLELSDNGIGIDLDKHREELFRPYKRFHHHIDGKGLGLFLVKSQVKALHGDITISSKLGDGSRFHIELKSSVG